MKTIGFQLNVLDKPIDVWEEIIRKEVDEEPAYFCDLTDIVRKHINWTNLLPRVVPFYAVKCNDSPIVLQLLAALGTGFDCASKGEIKKVLDVGVPPSKIIFANPTKPASHLNYAISTGVQSMTFDCAIELYKIKTVYPNAKLVLRIRCDAKVAQCPLGDKFGCDAELDAPGLLTLARELDLEVIGISFHVGSGCMDPPVYAKAIYTSKKLFDFAKQLGFNFHLLDIGGGFPGDKNTNLVELSYIINAALDQHFPNPEDVHVIAEPGRYYVSSAYTLITRIHSKREILRNGSTEKIMYFINDGVYGSFNCNIYDHKVVHPRTARDGLIEPAFRSSIWGPTCDALDQVCDNVMLPDLQINDLVVFENMGAYTIPIASPFNGFPLPTIEYYMEQGITSEIDCPALEDFLHDELNMLDDQILQSGDEEHLH